MTATQKLTKGTRVFVGDVTQGLLEITHNGFALLGLVVVFGVIALLTRQEIREATEAQVYDWLHNRQVAIHGVPATDAATPTSLTNSPIVPSSPAEHATAANPDDLPKQQAAVAYWLSKKYNVAAEPLSVLVAEAYETGSHVKVDPMLILAVMAVESSFNPFAQSAVGAQGLMQVMTEIHSDKYQGFGGKMAAFDPVTNLRVGVKVLKECIGKAGSVEGGLKFYVGAANLESDGGYTSKVMAEYNRLRQVAAGRSVPTMPPAVKPSPALPQPLTNEAIASS